MVTHYEYCPKCGKKLILRSAGEDGMVPFCESCGQMWFDAYPCSVIVLTHNEFNEVIMTKEPHLTSAHWVYNSGFILPGESAEHAARRELKEELGIEISRLENLGTYWFRGGVLMIMFLAYAPKTSFVPSEEIESACWTDVRTAAKLMGPVRPGCADFIMMKKYVEEYGICRAEELWPGQIIE